MTPDPRDPRDPGDPLPLSNVGFRLREAEISVENVWQYKRFGTETSKNLSEIKIFRDKYKFSLAKSMVCNRKSMNSSGIRWFSVENVWHTSILAPKHQKT